MSENIKSLEKALLVLEYLSMFPDGASLQSIATETKLNKASVFRIISTFVDKGYVQQNINNRNYRLSFKLLRLGQSSLHFDIIGVVKPVLLQLIESTKETINFSVREGDLMVFQDKLESNFSPFRTKAYVGMSTPMYCSASGKVVLAYSTLEEQQEYWLRNHKVMKQLTPNTIIEKDKFLNELNHIRTKGYAMDNEENEEGICCIAVPILIPDMSPLYSISLSTLTPRLKEKS